jgi:PTS system nitrogen regulatory IIA component
MEDGILTISEAAEYLRVSERTIYDWAQKGEIPAGKIGTVWHFKKESIDRWSNERYSTSKKIKKRFTMRMDEIIFRERILFINAEDAHNALAVISNNLCAAPQINDHEELRCAAQRREMLIKASVGGGVAIPRVRLPSVSGIAVSAGVSRAPVPGFLPLDGEPVRLVILVAAGYTQYASYLQTIAFINARLKSGKLRNAIIASKNINEAHRLLTS